MRTKLKINGFVAKPNGIVLHSKKHRGYASVATTDKNGDIVLRYGKSKHYEKTLFKKDKKKDFIFSLLCCIFFTLLALLFGSSGVEQIPTAAGIVRTVLAYLVLATVAIFLARVVFDSKTEMFKFYAAGNMLLNAYDDLGRLPELTEVRKYSRLHKNGYTDFFAILVIDWIANYFFHSFVAYSVHNLLVFAVVLVACNMILLFSGCLKFLQYIVTEQPTDLELNAAITALKVYLEYESKGLER